MQDYNLLKNILLILGVGMAVIIFIISAVHIYQKIKLKQKDDNFNSPSNTGKKVIYFVALSLLISVAGNGFLIYKISEMKEEYSDLYSKVSSIEYDFSRKNNDEESQDYAKRIDEVETEVQNLKRNTDSLDYQITDIQSKNREFDSNFHYLCQINYNLCIP